MVYDNEQIMKAFQIYAKLSMNGIADKEDCRTYMADDEIRGLVDQFAEAVGCTVFTAGDKLYFIPKAQNNFFHVTNETIKKNWLPARADNGDIYLLYIAIIVLFGEFYDSYQTIECTRDFISMDEWLDSLAERLAVIDSMDQEQLKAYEAEYKYNWVAIIEKWSAVNDISESSKTQDARTVSRLAFLNTYKNFLVGQDLIREIGNQEIELTEKAKIIIQKYYMEEEYNRGILNFIYSFENEKKGDV